MRPLNDMVWLWFPEGDRDVGGVRVPEGDPPKWLDAVVVAVGPAASADFGVGDVVLAGRFDGMPVDVEGERYRCVPASGVMAVLEG